MQDGLGLAEWVATGQCSAEELLDAALDRVERRNPSLNAVVHLFADRARDAIRAGLPQGPFKGVPMLLKDQLAAFAGEPMTAGSRLFRSFVPSRDAELVRRFKQTGAVIFGKTNMPEFGLAGVTEPALFGPCRNPWSLDHSPSGSSGGSASAVAARIVPIASAGDGGGSIRTPASVTGLIGLKPSRGRNPSGPDDPEHWWGFVGEHILSRSVRDSAAMLDSTAGFYPGHLYTCPPLPVRCRDDIMQPRKGLVIAIDDGPGLGTQIDPACRAAVQAAGTLLASMGHEVVSVASPTERDLFLRDFMLLVAADTAAGVADGREQLGRAMQVGDIEPATWLLHRMGETATGGETARAIWTLQQFTRRWLQWSHPFDALLTAASGQLPPRIGALDPGEDVEARLVALARADRVDPAVLRDIVANAASRTLDYNPFTMIANVTGQPSISVPFDRADGLPIGVMLTGRVGEDHVLLNLAAQIEQARPWSQSLPPMIAEERQKAGG
jgi:amidase